MKLTYLTTSPDTQPSESFGDSVSEALDEVVGAVTNLPDSTEEISTYLSGIFEVLAEYVLSYGGRLVVAVVFLIIGLRVIKSMNKKLKNAKFLSRVETSGKNFFFKAFDVVLKILLVILAASILGVPMASVVAVIGSAGLAIGLALEGSLGNIASGVVLMVTKPFREGDLIIIGSNDAGRVVDIGIFHTTIVTPDNRRIVYPNSVVAGATLINASAEQTRRVDLVFSVSYKENMQQVKQVIAEVIDKNPLIRKTPEPFIRLSKHADSALEFTVRVWAAADDYWNVYFDLTEQVKEAFDENGIEIPYPQMDIHIKENNQ